MDSRFIVPEGVDLLANGAIVYALFDAVQDLVEALRVEELLELLVEDFELVAEILIVVTIADAIDQLLARLQVARLSTSMKLILQSMLDLQLEVLRDVVAMSYVTDASHGHCDHELISETRQLSLQKANDVTV